MKNLIVCVIALVVCTFALTLTTSEAASNKPTFVTYILQAVAYDAAGNSATSAPVEVKVRTR